MIYSEWQKKNNQIFHNKVRKVQKLEVGQMQTSHKLMPLKTFLSLIFFECLIVHFEKKHQVLM